MTLGSIKHGGPFAVALALLAAALLMKFTAWGSREHLRVDLGSYDVRGTRVGLHQAVPDPR